MKIIVIGGGPAGIMAAISASQKGNQVILVEKMSTLGRKLLITGKGRCNITSSLDMEEFIKTLLVMENFYTVVLKVLQIKI